MGRAGAACRGRIWAPGERGLVALDAERAFGVDDVGARIAKYQIQRLRILLISS